MTTLFHDPQKGTRNPEPEQRSCDTAASRLKRNNALPSKKGRTLGASPLSTDARPMRVALLRRVARDQSKA